MGKPLVWAHRGASYIAPENTLEAFSLARDMGADGIELDVHLSADNELIVAHDDTVDRCSSGTGRIADMTLSEIKRLDFSNHKAGYGGVKAPTLEEVYELVKPTGMTVNVELKSGAVLYEGIEEKCVRLARALGMRDRVFYSSFNHYSLLLVKAAEPDARIAPLYQEALVEPWRYAALMGAQAIHPFYPTVATPRMMERLAETGLLCNPWTVDDEGALLWMARLGVNAVITNKPDFARRVFNSI
ncbi:MAG: glycerophosphodiester phosphodiesterase [Oscillospiraceae bacterium]|jgi:glycerophosphoryl diester phosphodiesterase|nr:glycerophosphodiester phosphodiesterase [Oscillospiraceae bacterium]